MTLIAISGPMSGLPNDNRGAFALAEEKLQTAGYDVANPVRYATADDIDLSAEMGEAFRETPNYRRLVNRCMEAIRQADGLCTLTGWQHSRGANAEVHYARALGLQCQPLDYWVARPVRMLKYTGPNEFAPRPGSYEGDAGWDLIVRADTRIPPGHFRDVPCGIRVELPPGVWGLVMGRSSTLRKRNLLIHASVIDNGYRGPMFAGTWNMGEEPAEVLAGERIAQLIPIRLEAPGVAVRQVSQLSETDRGEGGFGSTGL